MCTNQILAWTIPICACLMLVAVAILIFLFARLRNDYDKTSLAADVTKTLLRESADKIDLREQLNNLTTAMNHLAQNLGQFEDGLKLTVSVAEPFINLSNRLDQLEIRIETHEH